MAEKTKAELEAENAALRDELARVQAGRPTARPYEPSFEMSAGVAADIEQAQAILENNPDQEFLLVGDPMRGGHYKVTADGYTYVDPSEVRQQQATAGAVWVGDATPLNPPAGE